METKRKIAPALMTLAFCAGIVVLLLLFAFRTPLPLPEEEGVVIETNAGGGGGGSDEYFDKEFYESISSENTGETNENYTTQDVENVNYTSGQQSTTNSEKPKVDDRISNFSWGHGNGTGTGTGSGNGSGTGTGSGSGVGPGDGPGTGPGSGPGYILAGRGVKNIPKPAYNSDEQGKVVVTIWVDRDGNVTRAEPGAIGTTISDASVWKECKDKAMKAKFTTKSDAAEIQKGTITYTFIKQN
ncbi:hypothetical protein SDC9_71663 [bioreactor metagenome]|uniref:TonB C-terminal domain-containing protein n=1 Tax=bioreactor metagenome TaxID=1076179 RepID=A0A644YF66_9ZZZZ